HTDIRAARQVVQERLATLTDVLPDGIHPQMTPPTSIMGQIMIVGLYRQKGPSGGDLFPLEKTGLFVEFTDQAGQPSIAVWRPTDRRDVQGWQRVTVDRVIWVPSDSQRGHQERRVQVFVHGRSHQAVLRTPLQQQMDLRTLADWVIRPRLLQ